MTDNRVGNASHEGKWDANQNYWNLGKSYTNTDVITLRKTGTLVQTIKDGSVIGHRYLPNSSSVRVGIAFGAEVFQGIIEAKIKIIRNTQNSSCNRCPAGYSNTGGNTNCVPWGGSCSNGTLALQNQRTKNNHCGKCNKGFKLVNKSCQPCSAGTFQGSNNYSRNSCTNCRAGTYSSSRAASCTNCLAGKYSSARAASCTNCPAGKYQDQPGQSSCKSITSCIGGQYEGTPPTRTRNRVCLSYGGTCANGTLITQNQRTQENHCGSCKQGFKLVNKTCQPCPAGTFQGSNNYTRNPCTNCGAGHSVVRKHLYVPCVRSGHPVVLKNLLVLDVQLGNIVGLVVVLVVIVHEIQLATLQ